MMPFLANLIWPATIYLLGFEAIIPITMGLLLEWPFIKWITQSKWDNSLITTIIVNFISTIIGFVIFLIMLATTDLDSPFIISEIEGTLFSMALTYFFTVFLTICVEVLILNMFCETKYYQEMTGQKSPNVLRIWIGLTLANILSIAVTFAFFPHHPI
jgi:hypothetical protein